MEQDTGGSYADERRADIVGVEDQSVAQRLEQLPTEQTGAADRCCDA
jgi:hypothetical protein